MPLRVCEAAREEDIAPLTQCLASLPLLQRYQMDAQALGRNLLSAQRRGELVLVARTEQEGPPLAVIWGTATGGFGRAGYVRLLLVAAEAQGLGLGSVLLQTFEHSCQGPSGGFFVLTEEAAGGAEFYRRHGYEPVGPLNNFIRPGRTELLLWKCP